MNSWLFQLSHLSDLAVLSGTLSTISFLMYFRAIITRQIVPSKAAWIVWFLLDAMTFFGMWVTHTLNAQLCTVVVGSFISAILAYKYGTPEWEPLERACLGGAVLGIVAWAIARDPIFGILSGIVWNVVGAIPMFRTAWKEPEKERTAAWLFGTGSCGLSVYMVKSHRFVEIGQPIIFLLLNLSMIYLVYVRPALKLRTV